VPALERSAQILRAAGYDCVLQLEPISKAWDLLGVSPHGLILVSVVHGDWPEALGLQRHGGPPRWPTSTVRLLHGYADGSPWPEVRFL